jgi:hypothetical protein
MNETVRRATNAAQRCSISSALTMAKWFMKLSMEHKGRIGFESHKPIAFMFLARACELSELKGF